jgi:hypothetical protein
MILQLLHLLREYCVLGSPDVGKGKVSRLFASHTVIHTEGSVANGGLPCLMYPQPPFPDMNEADYKTVGSYSLPWFSAFQAETCCAPEPWVQANIAVLFLPSEPSARRKKCSSDGTNFRVLVLPILPMTDSTYIGRVMTRNWFSPLLRVYTS